MARATSSRDRARRSDVRAPLPVVILGVASALMMVPAAHASVARAHHTAQAFFYSGLAFGLLAILLGIALRGAPGRTRAGAHLGTLLATYLVLPLALAVPMMQALPDLRLIDAYSEMVSALTTTGAPMFQPDALSPTLHLWRALVAWSGGFFVWVSAVAIFAPLNLGGYEVTSTGTAGREMTGGPITHIANTGDRLRRFTQTLGPVYLALTALLWLILFLCGDRALVALIHAMSVMSTSGITPLLSQSESGGGMAAEVAMFVFMFFAISRLFFARESDPAGTRRLRDSIELRMALACLVIVPGILFTRHFFYAIEGLGLGWLGGLETLWGGLFTSLSFLTTTGFQSAFWQTAGHWSGLEAPGIILLGLALVGGGVATTAGGVKLLRVFALYAHAAREMGKLVHPSSVGGEGTSARQIRGRGAFIAWIFFMLIALSIAGVTTLLSLLGSDFGQGMILAVAALANCGPVAVVADSDPIVWGALPGGAKLVLDLAMVVGRLEVLALIAMLNPDYWR